MSNYFFIINFFKNYTQKVSGKSKREFLLRNQRTLAKRDSLTIIVSAKAPTVAGKYAYKKTTSERDGLCGGR